MYLEWDSKFFNLKIGEIRGHKISLIRDEIREAQKHSYDLLYIRIPGNVSQESLNCDLGNLVDVKTVFQFNTSNAIPYCIDPHIKLISQVSDSLYGLTIQAGHESRYKKDTNFPIGEFERLYKAWIDNSVSKKIADYVIGYFHGLKLVGFVTLKIKVQEGQIGLIAVDTSERGLGIGSKLLDATKALSSLNSVKKLSVATQMDNINACEFYKKNGFQLDKIETIFHKWLKKENDDTF